MIILPAIDVLSGRPVRLAQGDYATSETVAPSCADAAARFAAAGAEELHLVDLDGAKKGTPCHTALFADLMRTVPVPCEIGGGIRTDADLAATFAAGAARAILGSAALKDPAFVKRALDNYPQKIAVGIDARGGKVCTDGWLKASETDYLVFAKEMAALGAGYLIFTDIARDGMLSGPNLSALDALCAAVSCKVIASGGIRDLSHIRALARLPLYGAICGKSLYAGTLSLSDAIAAGRGVC